MWGRTSPSRNTGAPIWGASPVRKPISPIKEYDTRNAYFDWEKQSNDEPNGDILDIIMQIEKGKI
jgi:hypothetical protein